MTKKKLIKTIVICAVAVALLAGLIYLMLSDQTYGKPDSLGIGDSNFGERLLVGLQVVLMGLGTVFMMLFLLILTVTLMKWIFIGANKLKEKKAAEKTAATQEVAPIASSDGEDEEVVAAIMAALSAYYESQNVEYKSNLKFRVRSIKEI